MAIIGLLFILGAGAITAGAIYDGGESATFEVFGLSADTTLGGVFVAGLATMLIFFLGVWMLFSSMGRSRRRRLARKEARARERESVSQIESERAQLRAENERLNEQLATGRGGTAGTTAAGATAGAAGTTSAARTHGDTTTGSTTGSATDRGATDRGTTTGATTGAAGTGLDDRPQHVEGDRVVDHTTDLTQRDETASSTSGRHRDDV
jgi:ABC-type nickel/cobalt efflux system permease component RcnA